MVHSIRLYPGSMGLAGAAINLFGIKRVVAGTWPGPVYAHDVSDEEIEVARELLAKYNITVEVIPENEVPR